MKNKVYNIEYKQLNGNPHQIQNAILDNVYNDLFNLLVLKYRPICKHITSANVIKDKYVRTQMALIILDEYYKHLCCLLNNK